MTVSLTKQRSCGLGLVGAYSLDSLVNILPENFWGNR